jgi:hypothetical protein
MDNNDIYNYAHGYILQYLTDARHMVRILHRFYRYIQYIPDTDF